MRAALVLVVGVGLAGCAKKSTEPGAHETTASAPAVGGTAPAENVTALKSPTVAAPPPPVQSDEPKLGATDQAKEQARSSGVLGPTEQQAFASNGKVGIVSVGKKSTRALADVVKPALDKLQACYDKALEYQNTLAGELTLTVKDGKPTVAATTLKHAELEQCVVTAVAGLVLPKGKSTLVLAFARE